jgi:integrase
MPRQRKIPALRHHRPSGQASVRIDGKDHYLGKHGTPESRENYDRLIARWLTGRHEPVPASVPAARALTVSEMILAFYRHAEGYYRDQDGPTGELENLVVALRPLRKLYGSTPAAAFGPLALQVVRDEMIRSGLARTTINARVHRIRRVFRWSASAEMVPGSIVHDLDTVGPLKKGRTVAPETAPVEPVSEEHVAAVLPFVSRPVRAMIEVQSLCGARPGEVARMRGQDIDRSGPVWIYHPSRHKTQSRGKGRVIPLGPRTQEVLKPWLKDDPTAYLFSPAEASALQLQERRAHRKTPMTPSQAARRPKVNPQRAPRARYDKHGYRQAIARACKKAGIPAWHPHQLRHAVATRIRARYGLEAAQVVLGHAKADVTQVYAERDLSKAVGVMAEVG